MLLRQPLSSSTSEIHRLELIALQDEDSCDLVRPPPPRQLFSWLCTTTDSGKGNSPKARLSPLTTDLVATRRPQSITALFITKTGGSVSIDLSSAPQELGVSQQPNPCPLRPRPLVHVNPTIIMLREQRVVSRCRPTFDTSVYTQPSPFSSPTFLVRLTVCMITTPSYTIISNTMYYHYEHFLIIDPSMWASTSLVHCSWWRRLYSA